MKTTLPNRSGIYAIETPNGTQYVGSSRNIHRRFLDHRNMLVSGTHGNNRIRDAWLKHGANLRMRPILYCSIENLHFYEQRAIDVLHPALDISLNARGPHAFTAEHRERLAAAKRGKVGPRLGQSLSIDSRAAISAKLKGRKRSLEARAKQSATLSNGGWHKARK